MGGGVGCCVYFLVVLGLGGVVQIASPSLCSDRGRTLYYLRLVLPDVAALSLALAFLVWPTIDLAHSAADSASFSCRSACAFFPLIPSPSNASLFWADTHALGEISP